MQSGVVSLQVRKLSVLAFLAATALFIADFALAQADTIRGPIVPTQITLTEAGCQPNAIAAQAGRTTFLIQNNRKGEGEWEILNQEEFVVDEREHIPPGAAATMIANLDSGVYEMVCGLLSSPMGVLTVTVTDAARAKPSAMELVGPLAEYKVYVKSEVDALVAGVIKLVSALKAGKLEEAKSVYAPAHLHYERVEPIAELFNDLDGSMDSREDDFEKKSEDPKFLGFHRIEKGIFADKSTVGLASIADKLMNDALDLQKRIDGLTIAPKDLVGGAAELIEEVASKKITGEEDRYSRTDLWDFQANLDGAQKIVALLHPMIEKQDPKLSARLKENFAKIDGVLVKYKTEDGGFVSYDKLSEQDRTALKGPITTLAEDLSALKGTLGVE